MEAASSPRMSANYFHTFGFDYITVFFKTYFDIRTVQQD